MPDKSGISRRKILGGFAAAGSLGAVSGASINAHLHDSELFERNNLRSGTLDLEVAWKSGDGSQVFPDQDLTGFPNRWGDNPSVTLAFPSVEPGESGEATIAFRVCGNPGTVSVDADPAEDQTLGELAERIEVTLYRKADCTTEGVDYTIFEGSLYTLLRSNQYRLGEQEALETLCRRLGKLEAIEDRDGNQTILKPENQPEGVNLATATLPVSFTFDSTEVRITDVEFKDDMSEIVSVDLAVPDGGVCDVTVKNGDTETEYSFHCVREAEDLAAPTGENSGGQEVQYGISYIEISTCELEDGTIECFECTPTCLGFDWEVVGEEPIEESSVIDFSLDLAVEQCRHNGLLEEE